MRLSAHKSTARVGQVEIRGVQHVVEFEARERQHSSKRGHQGQQPTEAVSPGAIDAIQSRTAIVVPCKNEPVSRIMHVCAGIPASSLIVLVSASEEHRYALERAALASFCRDTGRDGLSVHQRDYQLAKALSEVGMTGLLGDDGRVHGGKGEALVIGIAVAAAAPGPGAAHGADAYAQTRTHQKCHGHNRNGERDGRISSQETDVPCSHGWTRGTTNGDTSQFRATCAARDSGTCRNKQSCGCGVGDGGRRTSTSTSYYKYIGFIDADNFVTGSVAEYCKAFSAGFHLVTAPDAMVRINWGSKPKVHDGKLVFKTSGRSSEVVNLHFNRLLGQLEKRGDCTFSGDACEYVENDKGHPELHHICTGNAGEHALTMSLALKLELAGNYAIEPYHLVDILRRFAGDHMAKPSASSPMHAPHSPTSTMSSSPVSTPGGTSACPSPNSETTAATSLFPASSPEPATPRVQVLQIRTMNPHFHDTDKGEAHIIRMWMQGLSAIYHSPLTADFAEFRDGLWGAILAGRLQINAGPNYYSPLTPPLTHFDECSRNLPSGPESAESNRASLEPARCRIYQPVGGFDLAMLRQSLLRNSTLFWSSAHAEERTFEDEDVVPVYITGDTAGASVIIDDEPAHERPPQRVARRDSGVDFGMDGVDHAGPAENAPPGSDLHEPPTREC
jgi:hypothetical protein